LAWQKTARKIRARADFELVAAGPLTITCFRYTPPGSADVEKLNRSLLEIIQGQGQVYLTSTDLNGEFVLRANIINFRTTEADLDFLLDTIAQAGQSII
jgi:glutamate/tyrosine decarboxylase-like PLP-dependent enzyme